MSGLQARYSRMSLAVKYASVLFPFDIAGFLTSLSKRAFFLPEDLETTLLAAPHGARLEPSGIVARKGEISVRLNVHGKVLAVHSLDPDDAVTEMDALESLLKQDFAVDSSSFAQFYELLADVTMEATVSPLESWAMHLGTTPIVQQISGLLGTDASPFGVRLVPAGRIPNEPDFFDIRIEPEVHSPAGSHYVSIVFRDPARDKVFAFARSLEQTLEALIALVEGAQAQ